MTSLEKPSLENTAEIDLAFLRSCLIDAGKMALGQRGQMTVAIKADNTPVTVVDKQVEDFLIERIHSRYPDHQILSEESGLHPSSNATTWVIDPIDGTRSFATGLPIWGVTIGILHLGEPIAGGVYLPVTDELYWGTPQQAFYNDQPMPRLSSIDLDSPLVFLAVPSSFHLHFTITYPCVRALGSTAAHLAYVATGAAVGALTRAISLWDIAGMLPVLAATGVKMVNLSGQPFQPSQMMDGKLAREPLLAALPQALPALLESIQKM